MSDEEHLREIACGTSICVSRLAIDERPAENRAQRRRTPDVIASDRAETASVKDDALLARALLSGDPAAPRAAWHRYWRLVRQIAKRVLGPSADVDDLVQEAFLRFFDRVMSLQEPKALRAFIISITVNVMRLEVRRRRVRRILTLTAEVPPIPVHLDMEAREALVHFCHVVDGLGAEDRTAFVLRFVDKMDLVDVASALQISLSTVKRRLARSWSRFAAHVTHDPALSSYLPPSKVARNERNAVDHRPSAFQLRERTEEL